MAGLTVAARCAGPRQHHRIVSISLLQTFRAQKCGSALCFGNSWHGERKSSSPLGPTRGIGKSSTRCGVLARAAGVIFHERAELHAKGIVGDAYSLIGSMNFTYNGLDRLTEMLVFQTERGNVEQLRLSFRREYGGKA